MKGFDFSTKRRSWMAKNKKVFMKIVCVAVIMMVSIGVHLHQQNSRTVELTESNTEAVETEEQEAQNLPGYVDISGEVQHPGVYQIDSSTRLYQLIEKAGGLTEDADLDAINQASFLEDGSKIIIPKEGAEQSDNASETDRRSTTSAVRGNNSDKININSASKEELMTLPGIGEVIAGRIIEYRTSSRFESCEELQQVDGIGAATYEKLKSMISV